MRIRPCSLALVMIAFARAASAQSPPVRLSLDEAVARAYDTSHRLAEAKAREEGARAAADAAAAGRRPQVSLQGGYTRTNHVTPFGVPAQPGAPIAIIYPDIPDNFRSRIDGQWPLYTGGRVESLTRAAEAEAGAVTSEVSAFRGDLRLDVTRAYWSAVTAGEAVHVVQQSLASIDAHLGDLRAALKAGLIPPNDVLSAEAQRAREQVQVIDAQNARELALAELRRLTGVSADVPIELASTLDAPGLAPAEDLASQVARAKAARPERAALQQRLDASSERIRAASSADKPSVALAGGLDYAKPNPKIFPRLPEWQSSWDVSVNASWLLWDGGRRGADRAQAEAAARAARERLAEFDTTVELEVRQRRLDLAAGLAAVAAAGEGVRAATEARRVVGERFKAGVATSTDVLDASVALLQAELDRTRALASVRLAEARLARAIGA